jgi:hypothetical protein
MNKFPDKIANEAQLEEMLSKPAAEVTEMFSRLDGDIMFLGVAGKIGISLAHMAKRACEEAGIKKRIIGVSNFENIEQQKMVGKYGIETIHGDLLDTKFTGALPAVRNIIYLVGMKFGSVDTCRIGRFKGD